MNRDIKSGGADVIENIIVSYDMKISEYIKNTINYLNQPEGFNFLRKPCITKLK